MRAIRHAAKGTKPNPQSISSSAENINRQLELKEKLIALQNNHHNCLSKKWFFNRQRIQRICDEISNDISSFEKKPQFAQKEAKVIVALNSVPACFEDKYYSVIERKYIKAIDPKKWIELNDENTSSTKPKDRPLVDVVKVRAVFHAEK